MQILLLTLIVGALNLCLGYAIGVRWRRWQGGVDGRADSPCRGPAAVAELGESKPSGPPPIAEPAAEQDESAEDDISALDVWRTKTEAGLAGLARLKKQLRESSLSDNSQAVWRAVVEFQELCESQKTQLETALEEVSVWVADAEARESAGAQLETALLDQTAQIETTLSNLGHFDFSTDFSVASKRLLSEISLLHAGGQALLELSASLTGASPELAESAA